MITSHVKIALRNLAKNRFFTAINIFGLAVGLACGIVLVLYIISELNYDTQHEDAQRIYRVILNWTGPNSEGWRAAGAPAPLGRTILKDRPEIESFSRLVPPYENDDSVLIVRGEDRFFEKKIFFADPEIINFFPIRFMMGNKKTALNKKNAILLTQKMSKKYFGEQNPLGQMLKMEFDYDLGSENVKIEEFEVTGLLADPPRSSHLQYHFLVSMATIAQNRPDFEDNWLNPHSKFCYIKLKKGCHPKEVEEHLPKYVDLQKELFRQRYKRDLNQNRRYVLQPITAIHMHDLNMEEREPKGNWLYIRIYSLIAGLVLLIGCLNFINLSTALFSTRIKEVGLKKVIGAGQLQLIRQFLTESYVVTFLAYLFALGITALLLPFFNSMAQTEIGLSDISHPLVILSLLLIFLITGTVSGLYPALISTRINPSRILQGHYIMRSQGNLVHNVLVISQFSISIFLLISTLFVFKQLSFMKGQSLGFDKEQKLVLRVKSNLHHLRHDFEAVSEAFGQDNSIKSAAVSSRVPGDTFSGGYLIWKAGEDRNSGKFIRAITMSPGYLELYGIEMAYGRTFEKGRKSDIENAIILNEEATRELGFATPQQAMGQQLTAHYHEKTKTVIGITRDFHVRGMQEKIIPLVMDVEESLLEKISIGIKAGMVPQAMEFVKNKWNEHFPNVPMEYGFLDDDFNQLYRYEEQVSRLLLVITSLGMIVACLGLSGLAAFVTWKRSKEIGIRKVLGASSFQILKHISSRLIGLVVLALFLTMPMAWLAVTKWLEGFAYRISPGTTTFVLVAVAMILLAFLTVFLQTIRSLRLNSVQALKEE